MYEFFRKIGDGVEKYGAQFFAWLWVQIQRGWAWSWAWFKAASRRTQLIVGGIAVFLLLALCGTITDAFPSANTNTANQTTPPNQSTTHQAPTATTRPITIFNGTPQPGATDAPTTIAATATHPVTVATNTPVIVATAKPKPPATATPKPKASPINGNPWGYTFTNTSRLLYSPVSQFCSSGYFTCVSSFNTSTNGYVVQCGNGEFSHSGGVHGACNKDGGEGRPVYY